MFESLRISTPHDEGVLQVSKSLKLQVLLDEIEMQALFAALPPFHIVQVSKPVASEEAIIPQERFLEVYGYYIFSLKEGKVPDESLTRHLFSAVFTADLKALYAMEVRSGRYLLKTIEPVVQLQAHNFFYSTLDRKYHPLVKGAESVTWGVQFSFPQIAQDPKSGMINRVGKDALNGPLFSSLQRWTREHTRPTPFIAEGVRSNEPIRIGKNCFAWIASHPQLIKKGIEVGGAHGN